MPTVGIYIAANDWRALEADGHDPAEWIRIYVKAGLSERVRPEAGDRLGGVRQGSAKKGTKPSEAARSESFEDPGLSKEEILEDWPLEQEAKDALAREGIVMPDWKPVKKKRK